MHANHSLPTILSFYSQKENGLLLNYFFIKKVNYPPNCLSQGVVLKIAPSFTFLLYPMNHLPKLAISTSCYQPIATTSFRSSTFAYLTAANSFSFPIVSLISHTM